jgi:anti-sigma factor ChrR (cupin superfamily)
VSVAAFGFTEARAGAVEAVTVGAGIIVHRLYRSGPEDDARRALVVTFPPGSQWSGDDVHLPGPEDVYVVRGIFYGLAGLRSVHGPGDFVHCDAGTRHSPSTDTGGELFVYYPAG